MTHTDKLKKAALPLILLFGLNSCNEQPPYHHYIEVAKANGSWTILDDAEALITPPDLEVALASYPLAATFFHNLSRTDKRNILQWIVLAKKAETRARRIAEVAALAQQQRKPSQF